MPWTGIRWRRLAASDPFAHVRSVTRWSGGFVATGDLVVTGELAHSKVWVSSDGRRWKPLDAAVFGPASVVVGVAAVGEAVVALTLQSRAYVNGTETEPESWGMTGPWQSWTSTDGRSWTPHPGPSLAVPSWFVHRTVLTGAGDGVVALALVGQPLAFTRDGATWETASLYDYPGGPAGWKAYSIAPFPPGFVSVGRVSPDITDSGAAQLGEVAIASADGRSWSSIALPANCPSGALIAGPAGLIMEGTESRSSHDFNPVWCSSLDGRSWRRLSGYPPVGTFYCEENGCPIPNGILLGSAERIVAYGGDPRPGAWVSLDGRSWRRLTFSGSRPPSTDAARGSVAVLLPFGLLFVNSDDGSAWFGAPET